jgi:hypothetical protein
MRAYERHHARWQLIWGLLLILMGVIFLFDRFFIFSFSHLIRLFWPLALIAFGVTKLLWRSTMQRLDQGQNNAQPTSI